LRPPVIQTDAHGLAIRVTWRRLRPWLFDLTGVPAGMKAANPGWDPLARIMPIAVSESVAQRFSRPFLNWTNRGSRGCGVLRKTTNKYSHDIDYFMISAHG
ncbi:MAG: hypothetical protein ACSLEZ_16210, partial [Thiobacillus sp.]